MQTFFWTSEVNLIFAHITSLIVFFFLIALWTSKFQFCLHFSIHLLMWKFLPRYSLLEVSSEAVWWFTRQNIDSSSSDLLPFGSNEWWNWIISIFGTICKLDICRWFKMTCSQKLTWFFGFLYRSSLWYWQQMQL